MIAALLTLTATFGGMASAQPQAAAKRAEISTEAFDASIAGAKEVMFADPRLAAARAGQAERLARSETRSPQRTARVATATWLQGEAALRLEDVARARPLIDRALNMLGKDMPPTKLKGDLLLSRGGIHIATADVADAVADYQAAHNIFRDIGETRSQSVALLSIAGLYQEAKDFEKSLKYFDQALEVYRGDPGLEMSIYNNRGDVLREMKRYDEGLAQFEHALAGARDARSPTLQARILTNIARLLLEKGDLAAADRAIARGMTLAQTGEAAEWRAQLNAIAAEAAFRHNRLDEAQRLITSSFAGVDTTTTTLASREAHKTAFQVYSATGRKDLALLHLVALKRLDDEVAKLAASANTALVAARFDFANQELRITKLKADDLQRKVAMEQAQSRFQRILFGSIGAAVLVVMALLAAGLIQSRRSRIRLSLSNTALEKALAAKTEFLATTSHEIRTPLNGILGMTQVMLADASLSAASRDRVGIVHDAGLNMRSLVDDILDVAKMETGNLEVEAAPFDLKAMLAEITRMWGEQARSKGLGFALELDNCPTGIVGDAARMRQLVSNLLSNAVKFTAEGSVTLRARCDDGRLLLSVADTGIGIPADKHHEIFESFKQADGATTRKFGGTGLGLAIVRNIALAMGGDVRVDSKEGEGATFTLDMPFVAAEIAAPKPSGAGPLLIVDRNPIARSMLKAVLEPRAGSVAFAASLADAETAVAAGSIVTMLIDEATAKAAGDDFYGTLTVLAAAAEAAGATTAILWANPAEEDRAALLATGIRQVIAKPIAGPALAAELYSSRPDNLALASRAA